MECLQDRHGVAATAAARVVRDIGKDQRRCGRQGEADRVVQAGQGGTEPVAPSPAGNCDFARQRAGGVLVGCRHHHGQPVERRIGKREPAHDGDILDAPGIGAFGHALLAEVDQFAVRAVGSVLAGQLRHRRRHDRQADAGQESRRAGQQTAQQHGRLGAAFAHVEMGVGAVADEPVQQGDIGVRHIGMQVERGDDRNLRADDAANQAKQRALRIMVPGRQSGAVQHEVDSVQAAGLRQVGLPALHQPIEKLLLHRPVRLGHCQKAGHRLPRAGRIHRSQKAWEFTQHAWCRRSRLGQQRRAADQGAGLEIGLRRDRGEPVAFDGEA